MHYTEPKLDEQGGWEFTDTERSHAMDECIERLGAYSFAADWADIVAESYPCTYTEDQLNDALDQADWIHGQLVVWRNASRSERPLIGHTIASALDMQEREAIEFMGALEAEAESYVESKMLDDELQRLIEGAE